MARATLRRAAILAAILIASTLGTPRGTRGDSGDGARTDVADAEALARTIYHEGVPYAEARKLTDAGAARLVEMLDDPAEARHHAQIVEVLGMSGRPGAYEAIARAAATGPEGEVDGATYRTRVALLAALGHLARDDERALAHLVAAATATGSTPAWSHRHLRGPRLAGLLQRSAATALALSGRKRARRVLKQLRIDARDAPQLERHLEEALRLHGRVAREGADAVSRGNRFGGRTR
jgi:hypothetical protein